MIELGEPAPNLRAIRPPSASLDGWETVARARERDEVERYTRLRESITDATTKALIDGILRVEREHERNLAGKWTAA